MAKKANAKIVKYPRGYKPCPACSKKMASRSMVCPSCDHRLTAKTVKTAKKRLVRASVDPESLAMLVKTLGGLSELSEALLMIEKCGGVDAIKDAIDHYNEMKEILG